MERPEPRELLASLPAAIFGEVAEWEYVGGTGAGGYFQVSPRVLVAVPRPGYVQCEADARESLREFRRIAGTAGESQAVVILVDFVVAQDSSSRRVWSEREEGGLRQSLALVCSSPLSRAIGSFFIGLNRPAVPTKMFKTFGEAIAWSKDQVGFSVGEG